MNKRIIFQELERCLKAGMYGDYKLCYIDDVPRTYFDYTPDAKEYRKTEEWKDYPNPDYIPGEQTLSAYFTPLVLEDQWGDDWDDAPYEYNAGTPYDDAYNEKGEREEFEMLEVLFYLPKQHMDIKFPSDYGCGNSPFCIRDINAGAVAWIYYRGKEWKSSKGAIAIHGGCNPAEFMERIQMIQDAVGPYDPDEEQCDE